MGKTPRGAAVVSRGSGPLAPATLRLRSRGVRGAGAAAPRLIGLAAPTSIVGKDCWAKARPPQAIKAESVAPPTKSA